METLEHVHWFITSRCDLACSYCFKPEFDPTETKERLGTLASLLVKNKVKKVTIGGGEPLLVKDLDSVLEILKNAGMYVCIHTNGTKLDKKRISDLSGLVDDIALPLDSLREPVQEKLRGKSFIPVLRRMPGLADNIIENGIKLGYHTVFTAINHKDIPLIYKFINERKFDYWRIYEFNDDLARKNYAFLKPNDKLKSQKLFKLFQTIDKLAGEATQQKGFTDCLLAKFILAEEHMKIYNDDRIQFVWRKDSSKPDYAFLDSTGNISFYTWFSFMERRVIGNLLNDSFSQIKKKLHEVEEKSMPYDEANENDFINAERDRPLWARIYDGFYETEEAEEVKPRYFSLFNHLQELYNAKNYPEE